MAKKEPQEGDQVHLLVACDKGVRPQEEVYEVIKILDKHSLKVMDNRGIKLNVHKSRVKIVETPAGADSPTQEERPMTSTAAPEVATQPEVKEEKTEAKKPAKKAAKKAAPKPKKENKNILPFDRDSWYKECGGGTYLTKECRFDHTTHTLIAHVCINASSGYYYTINTYQYPDGVTSVGKKNASGNKYPLKGKRMSRRVKVKKTGQMESRVSKGNETAEQLLARFQKKGYKIVEIS